MNRFEEWVIDSVAERQPKPFQFALKLGAFHLFAFLAGFALQFPTGFSAFWAPTGVGLAALLLAPYRWWPAILLWLTAVDTVATSIMFDVVALPDDGLKVGLAAFFIRKLD